jgi:hypothetical protein
MTKSHFILIDKIIEKIQKDSKKVTFNRIITELEFENKLRDKGEQYGKM